VGVAPSFRHSAVGPCPPGLHLHMAVDPELQVILIVSVLPPQLQTIANDGDAAVRTRAKVVRASRAFMISSCVNRAVAAKESLYTSRSF
jgi:hypothetical protein